MADLTAESLVSAPDAAAAPSQAGRASQSDAARRQVKQLALEFEAMLTTQMLREMRQSMLDDDKDGGGGFGAEAMTDTIDVELGHALAKNGGLGLASSMMRTMEHQIVDAAAGQAAKGPTQAVAAPAIEKAPAAHAAPVAMPTMAPVVSRAHQASAAISVAPAVARAYRAPAPAEDSSTDEPLRVPAGAVSSAYGWRRDPFTGHAKFHRGIDLALAYGTEVQAAGDGRVVFAGESRGYGQTVLIEHPSGQQTRYAHLSAAAVQQGDTVRAGQVVGRVGQTGRSTGPHLHFEVIDQGRTINPRAVHHDGN